MDWIIKTFTLSATTLSPQTMLLCGISSPPLQLTLKCDSNRLLTLKVSQGGFSSSRSSAPSHEWVEEARRRVTFIYSIFQESNMDYRIEIQGNGSNEFNLSPPPSTLWNQHFQVRCWHLLRLVCVVCGQITLLPPSSPQAPQDYCYYKYPNGQRFSTYSSDSKHYLAPEIVSQFAQDDMEFPSIP